MTKDKHATQERSRKDDLNEYPRQGNEKPKVDLVGNVVDNPNGERLVKADENDATHLENMANVQGSNKDDKTRQKARP